MFGISYISFLFSRSVMAKWDLRMAFRYTRFLTRWACRQDSWTVQLSISVIFISFPKTKAVCTFFFLLLDFRVGFVGSGI